MALNPMPLVQNGNFYLLLKVNASFQQLNCKTFWYMLSNKPGPRCLCTSIAAPTTLNESALTSFLVLSIRFKKLAEKKNTDLGFNLH